MIANTTGDSDFKFGMVITYMKWLLSEKIRDKILDLNC